MNISKLIHGALIVALLGILNMNLASAADAPKNLQGAWVGTIGKAKVRLCLSGEEDESSYYYEKYQKKIPLWVDTAEQLKILELDPNGSSDIHSDDSKVAAELLLRERKGYLTGEWISGKTRLPVQLKRSAEATSGVEELIKKTEEPYLSCPLEFYAPLIKKFKQTKGSYSDQDLPTIASLDSEDAANLNGYNPRHIKYIEPEISRWVIDLYNFSTPNFSFWGTLSFVRESPNYLVLSSSWGGDTGGAHPIQDSEELLFHKERRNRILTRSLFSSDVFGDKDALIHRGLSSKLEELYESENDEYPRECLEIVADSRFHPSSPQENGIHVQTRSSWAMRVCDADLLISWKDFLPYLSKEGEKVMKNFTK